MATNDNLDSLDQKLIELDIRIHARDTEIFHECLDMLREIWDHGTGEDLEAIPILLKKLNSLNDSSNEFVGPEDDSYKAIYVNGRGR